MTQTNPHHLMKTTGYTLLFLLLVHPVFGQIVPPVTIRSNTNPTSGLLYLAPNNRIPTPPFAPSLMVIGNDGKVVSSRVLKQYAYDFHTLPDGRLGYTLNRPNTAETPGSSLIYITDTTMKTVDSIPLAPRDYSLAMDAFIVLPNGNRLIVSHENLTIDMRTIAGEGADPAAVVQQSVLQEVDIDGQVLFQWKSLDHIPVTASYEDLKAPFIRYFQINSIDVDTDGNLLISARNASLVAKIHRSSGKVLWILGGRLNQFTFDNTAAPSEPAEFSYQHDVRRIANGNITLFDNGNLRSPQWSRVAEYQLDETKKTCRLVWRYRPTTDLYSVSQGSCQTLPNGNRLISWGSAVSNNRTLITEVNTNGETVFEAELPNSMIPYKVERLTTPLGRDAADVLIDEILPTNTYIYTRGKDTVGVSITYHTLISFFYNTTTARRFMWSPENPRFVRSKEKNAPIAIPPRTIYRSRMTITQEGMEKHGAEFRFKADLFGVTDPSNTLVYYRPIIGTGTFYPLSTRYNPNTRELVVDTSEVGEFCFGSPLDDPSTIASEGATDIYFAPNPTSDQLYVGGTKEISRISVFNTSGVVVATFAVAGTGTSIDTSPLSQGAYVVVLQGPGLSATKHLRIVR